MNARGCRLGLENAIGWVSQSVSQSAQSGLRWIFARRAGTNRTHKRNLTSQNAYKVAYGGFGKTKTAPGTHMWLSGNVYSGTFSECAWVA